ncbi:hypothetical protein VPHD408B_0186 [Vibrio phage D408b]
MGRKSKLRAALFLAHLRLELAVTDSGWLQYMCFTSAGSFWLGHKASRRAAIRELNREFVEIALDKKAANHLQGDIWGSTPVFYVKQHYIIISNELAGTPKYHARMMCNSELEMSIRKDLFQHWKKNLMETGL